MIFPYLVSYMELYVAAIHSQDILTPVYCSVSVTIFFSIWWLKYDENSSVAMIVGVIQSTFGEAIYYLKGS